MTALRKPAGTGSVTRVASGFWVRVRIAGKRMSLGVYPNEQEAEEVRLAALQRLARAEVPTVGAYTLREWGRRWLDQRELDGVRGIRTERSRWKVHVETAPFADDPIASLTAPVLSGWVRVVQMKQSATPHQRRRRRLSRKTVREIVLLLRRALDAAILEGLTHENPAARIKVRSEPRTHEPWTYLMPEEQRALLTCKAIPEADRLMMAFAIGTGLRAGEQWNLELADLRMEEPNPEVTVRYGSKGEAPKNGKIRHVPLFGLALTAARRWMRILPTYARRNPHRLVFPTRGGARRSKGKNLHKSVWRAGKGQKIDVFREHLREAGIVAERRHDGRPVRWHDLRHTCASSLVAGWWGHAWRLEEVKEVLGHSSILVTQRYVHLAQSEIRTLCEKTLDDMSGCTESPAGSSIC